jgi:hypothetical protein
MKTVAAVLAIVLFLVGIALAKTGFDFGMSLGSGAATVTGPVEPTGDTWQTEAMTWQGEGVLWQ